MSAEQVDHATEQNNTSTEEVDSTEATIEISEEPTDTKHNNTSTKEVDSTEATIEIIEELTDIHPITEAAKFGFQKSVKH